MVSKLEAASDKVIVSFTALFVPSHSTVSSASTTHLLFCVSATSLTPLPATIGTAVTGPRIARFKFTAVIISSLLLCGGHP